MRSAGKIGLKPWSLLRRALGGPGICSKKTSGWLRGERYSRHWYDLAAIAKTPYFAAACADQALARTVAEHKSLFFVEKDAAGARIDYFAATSGQLQLIPTGASLTALENDYTAMMEDGLLALNQPSFADIIEQCRAIQDEANRQDF